MICSTMLGDGLDRYVSIGKAGGNDWPRVVLHLVGPMGGAEKLTVSWQGAMRLAIDAPNNTKVKESIREVKGVKVDVLFHEVF